MNHRSHGCDVDSERVEERWLTIFERVKAKGYERETEKERDGERRREKERKRWIEREGKGEK